MRAGPLRHRITIQKATETQNAYGEPVASWSEFVQASASVDPISSREYFSAQRENAEITHRIRMRYRPNITHKMRVKWGERVFDIRSIINANSRNRSLELLCVEDV